MNHNKMYFVDTIVDLYLVKSSGIHKLKILLEIRKVLFIVRCCKIAHLRILKYFLQISMFRRHMDQLSIHAAAESI